MACKSYIHFKSGISMISTATWEDIPALESLLNSAYRGENSKQGWTTEADMISGAIRTNQENLRALMNKPGALFLKSTDEQGMLEGCVFLEKRKEKLYLGMLAVSPSRQAKGTGGQLMKAAEEQARKAGCSSIFMRVISLRHELIDWYKKKGYQATGETEPFTSGPFGQATVPFEFLVLEKPV